MLQFATGNTKMCLIPGLTFRCRNESFGIASIPGVLLCARGMDQVELLNNCEAVLLKPTLLLRQQFIGCQFCSVLLGLILWIVSIVFLTLTLTFRQIRSRMSKN